MKKITIGLAAVAVLLLAGCATTFPKKVSEQDCLILLKTEVVDKTHGQSNRKYFLNYSGGYPQQSLFSSRGYVLLLVHEPGVVIESVTSSIGVGTGSTGNFRTYSSGYKLPYEGGKAVVLDFVYVNTVTEGDARSTISRLTSRPLTDNERADLLTKLGQFPEYKTWAQ
jgi:hypothetical protein